ncbi:MAG: YfaZ family outer membrane protein [Pseudomonadales bacterium]
MFTRVTRRLPTLACAAVCGFLSTPVLAEEGPGYTYFDVGYVRTDIDDIDENVDSLGLAGSFALTDNLYLFADYEDGSASFDRIDVDVSTVAIGVGANFALSDTVDLFGEASYVNAELEAGDFVEIDENGFGLAAGVRAMVMPQLELNAGLSYVEIDELDDTSLDLGAVYSFTDVVALVLGASFADNANTYSAGVRFYINR